MNRKWLCDTPSPPRIPIFYTLTKIHKPSDSNWPPYIPGTQGPTEKLSAYDLLTDYF